MAYTQKNLDDLQAAMARGARRLRIGSEEVEFRTLDEMERMETRIKRDLGQEEKTRMIYPRTSTGWR